MARLRSFKTPEEIKKMPISNVREEYNKLAYDYERITENKILLCPCCNTWQSAEDGFYMDKRYATNRYPVCKRCLLKKVEQRQKDTDEPNETKESVQHVLQMMDKVYDDDFYNDCVKGALDGVNEKQRHSPFATYIVGIQSLPQWKGKGWKDSNFGDAAMSVDEEETRIIQKTVKAGRKRFGSGYTDDEYMILENEYQDWITRYECNTKAQEEVFENLSILKLLKKKALLKGDSTRDLDKQQQDWLDAGKLKPKQNTTDTLSDAQTFGTLIQKYEETRPLPEMDDEFKDVDKIGLYFDVFFRGHTSKMLGLKNAFSNIYERIIGKYAVTKPEYSEEEDSEAIFSKVFGTLDDE